MPPAGTPKEPTGAADPQTAPQADALPVEDTPPAPGDSASTDATPDAPASADAAPGDATPGVDATPGTDATPGVDATPGTDATPGVDATSADSAPVSRRHPRATLTTGTTRPEGGGRAAPGDASAPARQWPLLTVLGLAALGLLIVGTDLFPQAFRVGTLLVGVALLTGAVLRRTLPSVGMLAVRSRFTDMITYGVMGGLIVLLALMVQPQPWLKIPFLEDILHLTVT
ncbi:DUF3017 domain-containing protein [Streptomyces sp. NPDC093111]|uniref:DUF3017 domain-containing protein n=1 Tax=Streptomyces sp. NPDC093111 TaxID=3154978 RepID=UPI0034179068